MDDDLRTRALVAAAWAEQHGFENTRMALIEIIKTLDETKSGHDMGPNVSKFPQASKLPQDKRDAG